MSTDNKQDEQAGIAEHVQDSTLPHLVEAGVDFLVSKVKSKPTIWEVVGLTVVTAAAGYGAWKFFAPDPTPAAYKPRRRRSRISRS